MSIRLRTKHLKLQFDQRTEQEYVLLQQEQELRQQLEEVCKKLETMWLGDAGHVKRIMLSLRSKKVNTFYLTENAKAKSEVVLDYLQQEFKNTHDNETKMILEHNIVVLQNYIDCGCPFPTFQQLMFVPV